MTIMDSLTEDFKENFMGFGNRQVKFLGHGVGLTIGELPVIAKGFKMPIRENMVFAIEPKKPFRHRYGGNRKYLCRNTPW